jgi:hypothetical protein
VGVRQCRRESPIPYHATVAVVSKIAPLSPRQQSLPLPTQLARSRPPRDLHLNFLDIKQRDEPPDVRARKDTAATSLLLASDSETDTISLGANLT